MDQRWGRTRRGTVAALTTATALAFALVTAACTPGPGTPTTTTPPDADTIELVSTATVAGWDWSFYRNLEWPCAVSGYQTFVIGTPVGADPGATGTLWVRMRGGGVGWIFPDGRPGPTAANKTENPFEALVGFADNALVESVVAADTSARILSVSMCSHDLYSGTGARDPYNPRTEPDGTPVTTNGLVATQEAIDFATDAFPTDDVFLHGTSAGSAGALNLAWFMERRGTPPTGVVADSGTVNVQWELDQSAQGGNCARAEGQEELISIRFDPLLRDPANQTQLLLQRGELTVPLMHLWNQGDHNTCGDDLMVCTMPDGSTQVLWSTRCKNEPIRAAIEALPPSAGSESIGVCVDDPALDGPCDLHVVSTGGRPNTDPSTPTDYIGHITDWVLDLTGG